MNTIVIFENKFLDIVLTPLRNITKANGFENDMTILEGYLTHYASDLEKGLRGKSFPAIAAHSRSESINTQKPVHRGDPVAALNTRNIELECAVSAADPEKVNSNLESVLRDLKRTFATHRQDLTIIAVDFILPEGSNRYAFMRIDIQIVYNELWDN